MYIIGSTVSQICKAGALSHLLLYLHDGEARAGGGVGDGEGLVDLDGQDKQKYALYMYIVHAHLPYTSPSAIKAPKEDPHIISNISVTL